MHTYYYTHTYMHAHSHSHSHHYISLFLCSPAGEQELDSAPPALVVPSEKISLPPPLVYCAYTHALSNALFIPHSLQVRQRALSDEPFFTIEVQMKNRASFGRLFYAFLDTSMQTMLYNPIVGIRARDNLSST